MVNIHVLVVTVIVCISLEERRHSKQLATPPNTVKKELSVGVWGRLKSNTKHHTATTATTATTRVERLLYTGESAVTISRPQICTLLITYNNYQHIG